MVGSGGQYGKALFPSTIMLTRFRKLALSLPWIALGLLLSLAADRTSLAATGRLELTVIDKDTGKPVACRMHIVGPKTRPFKPGKAPFWHDHFALPGNIVLKLPLGEYRS
jgi:hypothetical protein